MPIVLNGTTGITNDSGYTGDGVSFADSTPANTLVTTSGGNVGIGTSSPVAPLHVNYTSSGLAPRISGSGLARLDLEDLDQADASRPFQYLSSDGGSLIFGNANRSGTSTTSSTERARIDSSGNLFFAKTTSAVPDVGIIMLTNGRLLVTSLDQDCLVLNRQSTDGVLAEFRHANTTEGSISISGTTVSYNGGHLARWAQTTTAKDESLVKGTVLSNLDEMNVYVDADGNPVENEQLNKVKVSDVEGDANVAGVFVNWTHDEAHNVDEINMAMTGDMIIRIAQGVTVQRGDLLMSAGDGTAKPQGDDIVRSKTIAKVTSTHVTCTYADGSYCVPCVLMAC